MISGYFLATKERKISSMIMKDIKLWFKVYYYSIILLIVAFFLDPSLIGKANILRSIFPIIFNGHWFITSYFVLMLIVPMINHFLLTSKKREIYFLFFVILFTSGIQSILPLGFVPFGGSLNLGILIAAYCFGAIVKIYNFRIKPLMSVILITIGLLVEYFFMIELRLKVFTNGVPPFIVAMPIFTLVAGLPSFYNKAINWLAASVFASYLIICNTFSNIILWNKILNTNRYFTHPILPGLVITTVLLLLTIIIDQLYIIIDKVTFSKIEVKVKKILMYQLDKI